MIRPASFVFYLVFLAGLAFACYRLPYPNFDRYIYEAIVRGKSQSIEDVYSAVKHSDPSAEASSLLDSPQHLRELEPLYSIRPIYIAGISLLARSMPILSAISLISAISVFAIGVVILLWTNRPLLSGFLIAAAPIAYVGRFGTPDAFATAFVVAALWLLDRRQSLALALLFLSLGIRTDNIVLLLAVLAFLAWERKLPALAAAACAAVAALIVAGINHVAGNYGWLVLFHFSFVGGRSPAEVPHTLTMGQYLRGVASGAFILNRAAVWLLVGCVAWRFRPNPLLLIVASAALVHFFLFPSGEDRYFVWAYVMAGVALIRCLDIAVGATGLKTAPA